MATIIFVGLIFSTLIGSIMKYWLGRAVHRYIKVSNPIEMAKHTQMIYRLMALMLGMPLLTCFIFLIGVSYLILFHGLFNLYTLRHLIIWVLYLMTYHYMSLLMTSCFLREKQTETTSDSIHSSTIIEDVSYTVKEEK